MFGTFFPGPLEAAHHITNGVPSQGYRENVCVEACYSRDVAYEGE